MRSSAEKLKSYDSFLSPINDIETIILYAANTKVTIPHQAQTFSYRQKLHCIRVRYS